MVYLSTRFFLSAIYLSTRVFFLVSAGTCCSGDSTCSGCWMCPGSDLRECWDPAVAEADACTESDGLSKYVDCLCNSYGKIAKCWSAGRCCTEYAPTLSAAINLCNLKTYPTDHLEKLKGLVKKAHNDAYYVRNTIWHNDSGRNVPKLSVYVNPYLGGSSDLESTSYHPSSTHNHHTGKSSSGYSSQSHYQSKSYSESWDGSSELQSTTSSEKEQSQHSSEKEKHSWEKEQTQQYSPVQKTSTKLVTTSPQQSHKKTQHYDKIHHLAKCSQQEHKCQATIANQYHKARRDKMSHVKRSQSPVIPRFSPHRNDAELWKRSVRVNSKGESECGIDFHGVEYPTQVPESVSRVFAEL